MADILDIDPEDLNEDDCKTLNRSPPLKRTYEKKWGTTGACNIR